MEKEEKLITVDGNEAAARMAHALSEVIAIYPITPATSMAELSDEWSAFGAKNIWGAVPVVIEMQSEAGAAGALHGAATTGALTTTFTSSQGLLLMIPNMYKIAGELTPVVFHIATRSIACGGLSMYCDHADIMACRETGFAMLGGVNVQEAHDMALIAHAATLQTRIPFIHFFDGFRTSHESQKIVENTRAVIEAMIDYQYIAEFKARALDPEKPSLRGTAQNPDIYFAGREAVNKFYDAAPAIVQGLMDRFAKLTGRRYKLFDYYGASDATEVVVTLGSSAEPIEETVDKLNAEGRKLGLIKVRLYRPFVGEAFIAALPGSVKKIAVLDRTKEPGSIGEPLYLDVSAAITEARAAGYTGNPAIYAGRYGLGSAEFTPAEAKAVFDNLLEPTPMNKFMVGIDDDVTHKSLSYDKSYHIVHKEIFEAMFYGLSADGTVGANKNSIKIVSEAGARYCQGYFSYEAKKAGGITISHLRFGDKPIKSAYFIRSADFLACHKFSFLERVDMLAQVKPGGVFLLTSQYGPSEVWSKMPRRVQRQIIDNKLKFYVIDAFKIAEEAGLGGRINIIMQAAFFATSGVVPRERALALIKDTVTKTYGRKGAEVVAKNIEIIERSAASVYAVDYPDHEEGSVEMTRFVPDGAPQFVREVTSALFAGTAASLPVSKLPVDGVWPTGTTQYEKRNVAENIPVWQSSTCVACGRCSLLCPHATIRVKVYEDATLKGAPATFKHKKMTTGPLSGQNYTVQVAPEDCTGCGVCVNACPTKNKGTLTMSKQFPLRESERDNWNFFLKIPECGDEGITCTPNAVATQLKRPLFEFSGACAGCGETPYVKLVTQLFGDRALIANASGCSSVYGGYMPATPYCTRKDGRGPAWSNSLFEDNAEFGLGMRLSGEMMMAFAKDLTSKTGITESNIVERLISNPQRTDGDMERQREDVAWLKKYLKGKSDPESVKLLAVADYLVYKSVWIIGGDGWAYDIGYGGVDHVLAGGKNVNLLVLDTEVYSNTGGQSSKSTPMGAIAKFAAGGKAILKKPLALMQSLYGNVYVAQINLGADASHAIKAIKEAEAYDGPSLIVAYSSCVSHGIDMSTSLDLGKLATRVGMWPLFRYNPMLRESGSNPFLLDCKEPDAKLEDYMYAQVRFKSLVATNPMRAGELMAALKKEVGKQYKELKYLADRPF